MTDVPLAFHCEHTAKASRVLALVSINEGPASLQSIFVCADAETAEEVSCLLHSAWFQGPSSHLQAAVGRLLASLPDEQASALKHYADHALAGTWPLHPDRRAASSRSPFDILEDEDEEVSSDEDPEHSSRDRLADLPGRVVRITSMLELHVYEPNRLFTAARAAGWEPMPHSDHDPDDLVGAVMTLADYPQIPGAEGLGNEMSGEFLAPHKGDEQKHQPPDFAALFPIPDCSCDQEDCEDCSSWHLTPRTADVLHTALCVLSDQAFDDADELGDEPAQKDHPDWGTFTRLPRITWNQNHDWRRQFARACYDLANDLRQGHWPLPRCFAEEMALHLALEDSDADEDTIQFDEDHAALPTGRDDYDWEGCSECLFQDHDVLQLFDLALDGIEDPDTEINQYYGIGDMRPEAWFNAFKNASPRDPQRGFHR
ncbi:hypothetical protein GCM10009550_24670 [Actinocorallia libanotica]|uniref:Uncharacterized protein n=2 Tax=Actinocorallia libanotica TaxID=46162 RepID=A0ABP4BG99_9ACTN